jgi:predicted nuclease of predicted toxin-antitoxin system
LRLLADTNVPRLVVAELRAAGHDVDYLAERDQDPGDAVLLLEAHREARVLLTKDHDIGALVFRDGATHAGVMLFDDLGDPRAECRLVLQALHDHESELAEAAFLRVTEAGVRQGTP